ncbi:hypothetical protein BK640_03320 [Pseudomonas protegens]|uniref:Uncharacterized protein n=1 Tax=Pseudomonas protegens TaxID=380021 RepID=A0A9Q6NA23_9PSED|nr:hypothetical protein A1395_05130 [Pseudomonas protegens]PYC37656.1 hypothetical protein DMX08_11560 [Pseudomonas protegens]ROL88226.1 hypothetical protein BK639_22515 [Pseudomonas protegens]ROM04245.1 hypothetical protein BK642_21280 [Pseudomonas protegens]ROM05581.1 hypothetical protein BK641_12370 [Pseudomonas protegens]
MGKTSERSLESIEACVPAITTFRPKVRVGSIQSDRVCQPWLDGKVDRCTRTAPITRFVGGRLSSDGDLAPGFMED